MSNAIARPKVNGAIIMWIEYSGMIDGNPYILNCYDFHADGSYDIDSVVFVDPTGVEDR